MTLLMAILAVVLPMPIHEGVSADAPATRVEHGCTADPLCTAPPTTTDPFPDVPGTPSDETWDRIAACESNGDWAIETGNGFSGGLQFTLTSWRAVGGFGRPSQASRDEQIYRADLLWLEQGWPAWPACSRKLGLR